jgi:hypothetical protein
VTRIHIEEGEIVKMEYTASARLVQLLHDHGGYRSVYEYIDTIIYFHDRTSKQYLSVATVTSRPAKCASTDDAGIDFFTKYSSMPTE